MVICIVLLVAAICLFVFSYSRKLEKPKSYSESAVLVKTIYMQGRYKAVFQSQSFTHLILDNRSVYEFGNRGDSYHIQFHFTDERVLYVNSVTPETVFGDTIYKPVVLSFVERNRP